MITIYSTSWGGQPLDRAEPYWTTLWPAMLVNTIKCGAHKPPGLTCLVQVGMVCQTCSVYLTVCVSVERLIAVCYPLQAKHICTQSRARLAVLITSVLAIGKV